MKRKIKYIILSILVVTITILIDVNIYKKIQSKVIEDEKITLYYEEPTIDIENDFIGVIDIEKINIHQGFYHILSSNNSLKKGIKVLKEDMDSILVLASHSGRSMVAKFNRLNQLEKGDIIDISYNNKRYVYKYDHLYRVEKTGHVYINYDKKQNALVLITCDLNNKKLQEVHIAYMI